MLDRLVHQADHRSLDLYYILANSQINALIGPDVDSWLTTVDQNSTITLTGMHTSDHLHGTRATGDCNLLGSVGIAVQVAITIVCAIAFLGVWLCESPRRPFLTWLFDISKQIVGAAYGKLYNISQSVVFAKLLRLSSDHQDQCVWYLLSITLDCFILTFLLWGANNLMRPILLDRYGIDIGDYDEQLNHKLSIPDVEQSEESRETCPPGAVRMWLQQLGVWLGIITAVRLGVSVLLFFVQEDFYALHARVFVTLGLESQTSKLLFAVLIYPTCADIFQIMVQDHFLKKQKQIVV